MNIENKVIFSISQLGGGGAEHVMMHLLNHFYNNEIEVELLVTNQYKKDANTVGLNENIPIYYLQDNLKGKTKKGIFVKLNSFFCRSFEKFKLKVPNCLAKKSFFNVYGRHVNSAIEYLSKNESAVVVAFLQPTIEILMVATKKTNNKIIISERADPYRFFKTRYANYFLKTYYPFVDYAVFQTNDAKSAYPKELQNKSEIILNPIPSNLPNAFEGERKKKIVNFCRLSSEKNLPMLIDAFDIFWETHKEYKLEIYGNGELRDEIINYAKTKSSANNILILPHENNLHDKIKDYQMFVSSSDSEGMSNSMLEAMAIGLPTICTDCPIGGARTVIKDGENGLLVPIKDVDKLANAIGKLADSKELQNKLSKNAQKIREEQSVKNIGDTWLRIIKNLE